VQLDAPPPVLHDEIGLALVDPEPGWRDRGDMHPMGTRDYRAAIVARTRVVEDLVDELVRDRGAAQYLLLGAGLDTYAQRHADLADRVTVFEIDQPGAQAWKRERLLELGYGVPPSLHLVPVDFESGQDWWAALLADGFIAARPAVVSSSGVSMYITKDATAATLRQLSALAPGSIVVMTFMLPIELADEADRPGLMGAARGAQASGTPWISFFTPDEMLALASDSGFARAEYVSTADLSARYLAGRPDGLRAASGEGVLIART
jgi:methyltransferase (TIGR00027 family)